MKKLDGIYAGIEEANRHAAYNIAVEQKRLHKNDLVIPGLETRPIEALPHDPLLEAITRPFRGYE